MITQNSLLLDAEGGNLGEAGRLDPPHAAVQSGGPSPSLDADLGARSDLNGIAGENVDCNLEIGRIAQLGQGRADGNGRFALLEDLQNAPIDRRQHGKALAGAVFSAAFQRRASLLASVFGGVMSAAGSGEFSLGRLERECVALELSYGGDALLAQLGRPVESGPGFGVQHARPLLQGHRLLD